MAQCRFDRDRTEAELARLTPSQRESLLRDKAEGKGNGGISGTIINHCLTKLLTLGDLGKPRLPEHKHDTRMFLYIFAVVYQETVCWTSDAETIRLRSLPQL
jgi:hypothetical protein